MPDDPGNRTEGDEGMSDLFDALVESIAGGTISNDEGKYMSLSKEDATEIVYTILAELKGRGYAVG